MMAEFTIYVITWLTIATIVVTVLDAHPEVIKFLCVVFDWIKRGIERGWDCIAHRSKKPREVSTPRRPELLKSLESDPFIAWSDEDLITWAEWRATWTGLDWVEASVPTQAELLRAQEWKLLEQEIELTHNQSLILTCEKFLKLQEAIRLALEAQKAKLRELEEEARRLGIHE